MENGKTRIIIRDGIKRRETAGSKQLIPTNLKEEDEIKKRIESAIDTILDETEYVRINENPPTIGVEKDTV